MIVYRTLEEVPAAPSVLSIGNFDGVHLGHRQVLREVVKEAQLRGARAMAVTFEPHPARILRPEHAPKLVTTLPVKIRLLEQLGLDALLVLPFNRDLSLITPDQFASEVLAKRLDAKQVHEGENFHFGHRAQGNTSGLAEFGKQYGFEVRAYPILRLHGEEVSSSNIRRLLSEGQVTRARQLLGRVFSIAAAPGRGRGIGHKFTVPTINLARYDELIPANGVYVTRTRVGQETFDSVTNVGNRPTFGEESFAVESHLLNFHPVEVTAETSVEVCFLKRLRPEIKWPDVDALRAQIAKDVHRSRRFFHLERLFAQGSPQ